MFIDLIEFKLIIVFLSFYLLKCDLPNMHSGWKVLMVPPGENYSILRFELRGSSNNVRARQVMVLGVPSKPLSSACLKTEVAMLKDCEAEALRLFRLLTSQVTKN